MWFPLKRSVGSKWPASRRFVAAFAAIAGGVLLYIPGVPGLGQRLYLWVARNRFRLVPCHGGVCTLPPKR